MVVFFRFMSSDLFEINDCRSDDINRKREECKNEFTFGVASVGMERRVATHGRRRMSKVYTDTLNASV